VLSIMELLGMQQGLLFWKNAIDDLGGIKGEGRERIWEFWKRVSWDGEGWCKEHTGVDLRTSKASS
jgi:hypothetical protein